MRPGLRSNTGLGDCVCGGRENDPLELRAGPQRDDRHVAEARVNLAWFGQRKRSSQPTFSSRAAQCQRSLAGEQIQGTAHAGGFPVPQRICACTWGDG